MEQFSFEGLGTSWNLMVDADQVDAAVWSELVAATNQFDTSFSRFIEGSQATQFRQAQAGTFPISETMMELLTVSDHLRQLTHGQHDPAIGGLFELLGYDQDYSFQVDEAALKTWQMPNWELHPLQQTITISGPVIFDFGGTGKGYWIDQLSRRLTEAGWPDHLVDGGGDMMATQKADGASWNVALEWPGKPDTAIGTISLLNQGFAASSTSRRHWGQWHHWVDPVLKQPVEKLLGSFAVANSAWTADQATSALTHLPPAEYASVTHQLGAEYLVLSTKATATRSPGWSGELFLGKRT